MERTDPRALSKREVEVLRQLAKGLTNKKIAQALDSKETTIKVHMRNIYPKINVANRVQAAVWAIANLTPDA